MRGRTFTREFRLDVVRQVASGTKRPAQVCREHQLSASLLAHWRKAYEERREAAFTPRSLDGQASSEQRVAELERRCGQLALENAALRKALQHLQARAAATSTSGAH
jgi:transposase-like protein